MPTQYSRTEGLDQLVLMVSSAVKLAIILHELAASYLGDMTTTVVNMLEMENSGK